MEKREALSCPICGGDGHDGWIRCRKHDQMICMKCCVACNDHKKFSGLFNCSYGEGFASRAEEDIRHLENQIKTKDLQIRLALRRGSKEDAEKAREEKYSIERSLIRKKRTLEGYSRADKRTI
ncbi:hypothetical protein [Mobilibacterium timonense]|uniref:hypothetical protein n=1 Tax=Mobilibacterium timonense TaxID=1871012 RepID=UPI000985D8E8|nr:hypothetical protein [Mobilibacterium timonense]